MTDCLIVPAPPGSRIFNEARYLEEWILYHYLLGFDHFMLWVLFQSLLLPGAPADIHTSTFAGCL